MTGSFFDITDSVITGLNIDFNTLEMNFLVDTLKTFENVCITGSFLLTSISPSKNTLFRKHNYIWFLNGFDIQKINSLNDFVNSPRMQYICTDIPGMIVCDDDKIVHHLVNTQHNTVSDIFEICCLDDSEQIALVLRNGSPRVLCSDRFLKFMSTGIVSWLNIKNCSSVADSRGFPLSANLSTVAERCQQLTNLSSKSYSLREIFPDDSPLEDQYRNFLSLKIYYLDHFLNGLPTDDFSIDMIPEETPETLEYLFEPLCDFGNSCYIEDDGNGKIRTAFIDDDFYNLFQKISGEKCLDIIQKNAETCPIVSIDFYPSPECELAPDFFCLSSDFQISSIGECVPGCYRAYGKLKLVYNKNEKTYKLEKIVSMVLFYRETNLE